MQVDGRALVFDTMEVTHERAGKLLDLYEMTGQVLDRKVYHTVGNTGGAVSGNWWHGTHLGTAEGYMVVHVDGNQVSTGYRTYGFRSIDSKNT